MVWSKTVERAKVILHAQLSGHRCAREPNESNSHRAMLFYSRLESARLTLKGEAGAELVASLVELLGIERAANAESQSAVDLGVVRERGNAEVVDLGLFCVKFQSSPITEGPSRTLAKEAGSSLYLAASSRPTLEPDFESQVARAPASTAGLTRW